MDDECLRTCRMRYGRSPDCAGSRRVTKLGHRVSLESPRATKGDEVGCKFISQKTETISYLGGAEDLTCMRELNEVSFRVMF